jgi:hypothetical protein
MSEVGWWQAEASEGDLQMCPELLKGAVSLAAL